MSSKRADKYAKQEQAQQEQSVHGEASNEQGHSGEGAASAFAHMVQQDQKHRRESGHDDDQGAQG